MSRQFRTRRDGFTLLEVLISVVILIAMMVVVFQFTLRGQEMARVDTIKATLQARAMRIVEDVVDSIRRSGANQIVPASPVGTETSIDFLQVTGLDPAAGPIYSANPLTFTLSAAPNDPQDGRDNNDNGIIDEMVLRRTTPDGATAIVATGIKGWDEGTGTNVLGFRVRRAPNTSRLRLALTLQQADRHGRLYEETYFSSVTLRNE